MNLFNLDADRRKSRRERLRNTKSGKSERVHARFAALIQKYFGIREIRTKIRCYF